MGSTEPNFEIMVTDNFQNGLSLLPEPAVLMDTNTKVLSCNRLFLHLFDLEEIDIIDKDISILFPDTNLLQSFTKKLHSDISPENPIQIPTRVCTKSHGDIPVVFVAIPYKLNSENFNTYFLVVHHSPSYRDQSLGDVLAGIPIPFLRVSRDGVIIFANERSWIILSHWQKEVGQLVPQEFMEQLQKSSDSLEDGGIEIRIGFRIYQIMIVWFAAQGYADIFAFDVTSKKRAEEKLELNAQVFEAAFEGIVVTDVEKRILDVNSTFCQITGYSREEILGESIAILRSEKHDNQFYDDMWRSVDEKGSWQGEIWDRNKNGDVIPKWVSISLVRDESGQISRYVGLFSDISVIKSTEEKLYQMANYDAVTGLVNRRYFLDQLERNIQQSSRSNEKLAVMFIDLDGFKLVNDTLGHPAGDRLLCVVSERLQECIRHSDIVARMGGDEFTIILNSIKKSSNIPPIANKILRKVAEPIAMKNGDNFVSASIGIALYPDDATAVEQLIQNADTALYHAKENGKNNFQFFSQNMNKSAVEKYSIQSELHKALEKGQFSVYYQPQYNLFTKKLIGMEALIRWKNGQGKFENPEIFVAVAEERGLIHEIGEFVLKTVCQDGKTWRDEGLLNVPISINLSSFQLNRPDFVSVFERNVNKYGFNPAYLEIELTERTLINNNGQIKNKLDSLKSMGCSITIDDFGVKFSSLSYLRTFPIDKIKIDKSFIKDIPHNQKSNDIVKAIIAMSQSLKLRILAEGVETEEQAHYLKINGCSQIQGYYFSHPLSSPDVTSLLYEFKK